MGDLYRGIVFLLSLCSVIYSQGNFTELNLKGKEALKAGNIKSAENFFYESVKSNKDADSQLQLAKIYYSSIDSKLRNLGYDYISQAYAAVPDNLEIKYLYLDYLEWFGKRSKRLEEYTRIYNGDNSQAKALVKIASIHLAEYEKYRALSVDTEKWFLDEDVIPFDLTPSVKCELDSAEIFYLKALTIDPKNYEGLFGIAKMYQSTTKPEKAIDYLKKILSFYPDDKDAHLQLGVFYYKKKKLDESFKEFQKAMPLMDAKEQEDFVYNSVIRLLEPKYFEPFRTMTVDQKRALIEKWWKASDPLYLSDYNERIMEHYARVAYANLFFSVPNIGLMGWESDRGQVLIRYGEPARKEKVKQKKNLDSDLKNIGLVKSSVTNEITLSDKNALKYGIAPAEVINTLGIPGTFIEMWEYDNIPGFVFSGDLNYYKFVSNNELEEILRKREKPRAINVRPGDAIPSAPSSLDSRSTINSLKDYESLKRQKVQSYTPVLYGSKINTGFKLFLFNKLSGRADDNIEMFASYQVPLTDSTGKKLPDCTHEIGLFVFDQNFDPVMQVRDNIEQSVIIGNPGSQGGEPVFSIGLSFKPRKISFAFDLRRRADSNYFSVRKTMDLLKAGSKELGISDLVLTNNIEFDKELQFGIKRGDLSFYPKAVNRFRNGEQFFIYYEVYNLKLDDNKEGDYQQVITIKPKGDEDTVLKKIVKGITTIFSGEEGKVSLTANYRTKEENTQVYMQIDISGYKPGKYDLIITLIDKVSEKQVEKKIDLEIL